MSRNARIEEVSDSDPEDVDISLYDPRPPTYTPSAPTYTPPTTTPPAFSSTPGTNYVSAGDASAYKAYTCLYPIYFDSTRSRAQGRRVHATLGSANPLARGIVDACAHLQLKTVFEPGKTHPKDWANPGRVRVLLKQPDGGGGGSSVKNKFMLLKSVALYLKEHPTLETDPLKLRLPNMPFDAKVPAPPAVPRGWRMGAVLPLHSAALSGGGVSDDIFREMMRDMGVPAETLGVEGKEQAEGRREKRERRKKK